MLGEETRSKCCPTLDVFTPERLSRTRDQPSKKDEKFRFTRLYFKNGLKSNTRTLVNKTAHSGRRVGLPRHVPSTVLQRFRRGTTVPID